MFYVASPMQKFDPVLNKHTYIFCSSISTNLDLRYQNTCVSKFCFALLCRCKNLIPFWKESGAERRRRFHVLKWDHFTACLTATVSFNIFLRQDFSQNFSHFLWNLGTLDSLKKIVSNYLSYKIFSLKFYITSLAPGYGLKFNGKQCN